MLVYHLTTSSRIDGNLIELEVFFLESLMLEGDIKVTHVNGNIPGVWSALLSTSKAYKSNSDTLHRPPMRCGGIRLQIVF